jgi:aminomethyltransferase
MTAFAGYDMPVQYADGVLKEHLWTREHAGVFDVSHMGVATLRLANPSGDPKADHRAVSELLEPLICGDLKGLRRGQLRYSLLLNTHGGICDDLIIGRPAGQADQGTLQLVVNAAVKDADFARIEAHIGGAGRLAWIEDHVLIAVQGPEAEAVVASLIPEAGSLSFMTMAETKFEGSRAIVSRSGYTGEDGFEALLPADPGRRFWDAVLADQRARPVGLGARDSLRLEAGLPLYGHDMDERISPIEASLDFAVSKRRREAEDFPGAAFVCGELAGRLERRRVGLAVLEGAPAREGAEITDAAGVVVGRVTSGGFSPTLKAPIAMGYVPPTLAEPGAELFVLVRGKPQAAKVVDLPFVPHRYHRKSQEPEKA